MTLHEFLKKKKKEYEERFQPGNRAWRTAEEKDWLIQQWFVSSLGEGLHLFPSRGRISREQC